MHTYITKRNPNGVIRTIYGRVSDDELQTSEWMIYWNGSRLNPHVYCMVIRDLTLIIFYANEYFCFWFDYIVLNLFDESNQLRPSTPPRNDRAVFKWFILLSVRRRERNITKAQELRNWWETRNLLASREWCFIDAIRDWNCKLLYFIEINYFNDCMLASLSSIVVRRRCRCRCRCLLHHGTDWCNCILLLLFFYSHFYTY